MPVAFTGYTCTLYFNRLGPTKGNSGAVSIGKKESPAVRRGRTKDTPGILIRRSSFLLKFKDLGTLNEDNSERIACSQCKKLFRKVSLYMHQRYVCGKGLDYKCPNCPYMCRRRFIACDMRRFCCDKCEKRYMHKTDLNRHKRFECGKEPQFQCPYCPHKAKQKANIKKHIYVIHFKGTPSSSFFPFL
uniref:C2H2-type domain-containing protein n=1 Tax=Rhodnius prolixus TaxID=13249 RepID=T1HQ15_RHOPR